MSLPCAVELPSTLHAPGQARRFVAAELNGLVDRAQLDTALLVVSELVTNAVLHARTPCRVELTGSNGVLQVRVSDGAATLPQQRPSRGEEQTSGRGLQILEQLCLRWGVDDTSAQGKVIWADISR